MKSVTKLSLVLTAAVAITLGTYGVVRSHCEIPCGIYGDMTRIALLKEHVATVEKSMKQIEALQKESPVNYNQLVRWVGNKEKHADEIQHIVTQYFMTQRCKAKPPATGAYNTYVTQITSLHGMLVSAMKAKQTTDVAHCKSILDHLNKFAEAYLSPEDLKHLNAHK